MSQIAALDEKELDFDGPDRWLKEAESIADDSNRNKVQELRCLLMHLRGQTDSAIKTLSNIPGDSALALRLALLLDTENLTYAAPLVEKVLPKASIDEEYAKLLARYYLLMDQPSEAKQILDQWIERSEGNPTIRELAGYIYAKLAQERRDIFCKNHNVLQYVSIILKHDELIDCGDESNGDKSAQFFEEAAGLFVDLGETERALECYKYAFAVRQMCKAPLKELQKLSRNMRNLSADEPIVALNELSQQKGIASLELKDFEKMMQYDQFVAYAAAQLEEWGKATGAWQEAADFLEREDIQDKISFFDERALIVMMRMKFWENAGDSAKALRAIDSFLPPIHTPICLSC